MNERKRERAEIDNPASEHYHKFKCPRSASFFLSLPDLSFPDFSPSFYLSPAREHFPMTAALFTAYFMAKTQFGRGGCCAFSGD